MQANYSQFLAQPVTIHQRSGRSSSFQEDLKHGSRVGLGLRVWNYQGTSLLSLVQYDRLPMGFSLDVERSEHPNADLPFDVHDANFTLRFTRLGFGLGVEHEFRLGNKWSLDISGSAVHNIFTSSTSYHLGVGARGDTASVWVLGLDVQVFRGQSVWHVAVGTEINYHYSDRHSFSFGVYYDRPFGSVFTQGQAVVLGLTEYRTVVDFSQSGRIYGLSLSYRYTWHGKENGR